jgi:uncharacterized protein YdcH (DUF465 family)
MFEGSIKFSYQSKSKTQYRSISETCPELVDDEIITIESPYTDLSVYQYFGMFRRFLLAVGFNETSILDGAFHLALNDSNDEAVVDKLMDEYEIQNKCIYNDRDYYELQDKYNELKAKLSRLENPDNPQYTEEELNAMMSKKFKEWGDLIPGSEEAIAKGCTCPYLDNLEMPNDRKWVSGDCLIHGKKTM